MNKVWLVVQERGSTRRVPFEGELLRLGGAQADVLLREAAVGELRLFREPLRAEHIGGGDLPLFAGRPERRSNVRPGESFEWCGARLTLEVEGAAALEELALESLTMAPASGAPPGLVEQLGWRMLAGLRAEQNLADPAAVERWQRTVIDGRFDPDAAAQELGRLESTEAGRVLERSASLLRDLLMSSMTAKQRSPARKLRRAASGFAAFMLAQLLGLVVYSLLVTLALLLAYRMGHSLDALAQRVLRGFG